MFDELSPQPRLRAGDADRDAVLRVLQEAHAAGRLGVEELAERQEGVLEARYFDELLPVVADLPEARSLAGGTPTPAPPPARAVGATTPLTITLMSGRAVDVAPGTAVYRNFAWWGGDQIYLGDALGPGVVLTLNLSAVMAGHDIYVPEGVRIVDETLAIMAGNDIDGDARGDGSNGTLILRGFLWWAGHEVHLTSRARH